MQLWQESKNSDCHISFHVLILLEEPFKSEYFFLTLTDFVLLSYFITNFSTILPFFLAFLVEGIDKVHHPLCRCIYY